jgi:uncharacterized membrane protein
VLCELVAGGVPDEIYADKAALLLAEVEPDTAVAAARLELATELLDDLRRVESAAIDFVCGIDLDDRSAQRHGLERFCTPKL